jgi:hypothetical protein
MTVAVNVIRNCSHQELKLQLAAGLKEMKDTDVVGETRKDLISRYGCAKEIDSLEVSLDRLYKGPTAEKEMVEVLAKLQV